jgi:hypothetical protein
MGTNGVWNIGSRRYVEHGLTRVAREGDELRFEARRFLKEAPPRQLPMWRQAPPATANNGPQLSFDEAPRG